MFAPVARDDDLPIIKEVLGKTSYDFKLILSKMDLPALKSLNKVDYVVNRCGIWLLILIMFIIVWIGHRRESKNGQNQCIRETLLQHHSGIHGSAGPQLTQRVPRSEPDSHPE